MKYEFIPVNQSILAKPMKEEDWLKLAGVDPDEEKKVGSLVLPKDVTNKEKYGMVNYAKARVIKVNDTEDAPFDVKINDVVMYNAGATILRDAFGDPSVEMVQYKDIIILMREET